MKIVVNRCFGGFLLSNEALTMLVERGSMGLRSMSEKEYFGPSGRPKSGIEKIKPWKYGFGVGLIPGVLFKNGKVYFFEDYIDEHRVCQNLVDVVLQLGSKASGDISKLSVIEIPDGIDWYIHKYDGLETIHEVHRSWG